MVEFIAVSTFFPLAGQGPWVWGHSSPQFLQVFVFALALTKSIFVSSCCSSYLQGRNLSDIWGGGVYSYIGVMPYGFLLKSTQIQKKSVGHNTNIWINTSPQLSLKLRPAYLSSSICRASTLLRSNWRPVARRSWSVIFGSLDVPYRTICSVISKSAYAKLQRLDSVRSRVKYWSSFSAFPCLACRNW